WAFDQRRAGGRLVANVGSIDNSAAVREVLQTKAGDAQVLMINLARGNDQLERLHFEALHPTFLVSAVKQPLAAGTTPFTALPRANSGRANRFRRTSAVISWLARLGS